MTPAQARGLLRRWRAGDTRPAEIDEGLALLAELLDQNERARAKVAELIAPVGDLRAAGDRAQEFLVDTGDKWGR